MPNKPKQIKRNWVVDRKPFERERTHDDFDYNGRRWRKTRLMKLEAQPLCEVCLNEDRTTAATVVDHEPTAKELMSRGLDPYDMQYLQSMCRSHHDSKSGRERHRKGGMGSNP